MKTKILQIPPNPQTDFDRAVQAYLDEFNRNVISDIQSLNSGVDGDFSVGNDLTVDGDVSADGDISADGAMSAGSLSVDGVDWDFTNDKVMNGYQKLPNGLILQWGYSNGNPTFPIEFPNACLRVVPQIYYPSSNAFAGGHVAVTGMSTTGFTRSLTTISIYYIAIGY